MDGSAELAALRERVAELESEVHSLRGRLAGYEAPAGAATGGGPDGPPPAGPDAETGAFETSVDLAGLLDVVSGHLYSTPLVAVRELVQNSHDSIVRRRRAEGGARPGRIAIAIEGDRLVVTDDGIGMTVAEIHAELATVGRGATGATRRATGDPELIGQFGLGFLSAFVLGSDIEVGTVSISDPGTRNHYSSADGLTYDLGSGPAGPDDRPGTRVSVRLGEAGRDLADLDRLRTVLGRYCALLRVPVEVGGETVNLRAPWRTGYDDPTVARTAALAFAAGFEHGTEPLCTIPVVPTAGSDATGLLWIQDAGSYATSDNRNLAVFVRGMLLDDDARELLPRWAGMVGGAVESSDLVPTASREDLQRTAAYDAVQQALAEQLLAGLRAIADTEPETWRRIVRRHNEALLGAAVADDDVFSLVADIVEVPTSEGDLRPADLLARSGGRLHVSSSISGGFEETICRCLRVPVARGLRFGVMLFLRRWAAREGASLLEIGSGAGDDALFRPVEVGPDVAAWLQGHLAAPDEIVITSRFEPAALPLVVVPDREAELKARIEDDDADRRVSTAALALARAHTSAFESRPPARLHLNLASPAVAALVAAVEGGDPRAPAGAATLRAVKALLGSAGTEGAGGDLVGALDHMTAIVRRDLEAGPTGEEPA